MADMDAPPSWQQFLMNRGAQISNGTVADFGQADNERRIAATGDALVDLSSLALWSVDGGDAEAFLQGQLSNDIRRANSGHAQLSAYCTPKGRMLAIFLVLRHATGYWLQCPSSLAETTFRRLGMYVLRAKVQLSNKSPELVRFGISGPRAAALLADAGVPVPPVPFAMSNAANVTVVQVPGIYPRFELVAGPADAEHLWLALSAHATEAGFSRWKWLDIMAGLPSVEPGTIEEFVPQMTNLELIGGVDFKKGCYPGQEIVARMHYLGHLKQRMVRGRVESDTLLSAGTPVFAPNFSGQSAGRIVDAQRGPDSATDLLVVAQTSSLRESTLHIADAHGPTVQIEPLPYAVPLD